MKVAVIKYGCGNVRSLCNELIRLGAEPCLTDDVRLIQSADRVIFPGQGEASTAMRNLKQLGLHDIIPSLKQPFLGICIGLQLMCKHSEEGDVDCLGIFDINVKRFSTKNNSFKIPHMGWNNIEACSSPLLDGVNNEFVYYVHSYYVPVCAYTIATTDYIQPFSAAINKDNFYATQFHPEKSESVGSRIIDNFLKITWK